MPVSVPQVLDLLLALVLVMFVPIGLWRGALREWMTLAGILVGWIMQVEWSGSSSWGGDLAALLKLDPTLASFFVAALLFLGTALIVGYGSGAMLPYRPDLSWPNRAFGACLGLGNGVLILSGLLRIMDQTLFGGQSGSPLRLSGLGEFLIVYVGWAYLLMLIVLLGGIVAGVAARLAGRPALLDEFLPYGEPALAWQENGAAAPPWSATPESVWNGVPVHTPAANERGRMHSSDEHDTAVLEPVAAAPMSEAATIPGATAALPLVAILPMSAPGNGGQSTRSENTRSAETNQAVSAPGKTTASPPTPDSRPANGAAKTPCAICGAALAPGARFCASCGNVLGPSEHRTITRES
jgi:hypothetical protein